MVSGLIDIEHIIRVFGLIRTFSAINIISIGMYFLTNRITCQLVICANSESVLFLNTFHTLDEPLHPRLFLRPKSFRLLRGEMWWGGTERRWGFLRRCHLSGSGDSRDRFLKTYPWRGPALQGGRPHRRELKGSE